MDEQSERERVAEWMKSLGFTKKLPTIEGYSIIYKHPQLDVAINEESAIFFHAHLEAAKREAIQQFVKQATLKARHYTADGLIADGLDPWAISVAELATLSPAKKEKEQ